MPIARHLFNAIFQPAALVASIEMDRIRTQAKAAGVSKTFDILWRAEQYRASSIPGPCLSPQEALQIALATGEE